MFYQMTTYVVRIDLEGRYWIEKTTCGNALRLIDEGKATAHFLDANEAGRYADLCNHPDPVEV